MDGRLMHSVVDDGVEFAWRAAEKYAEKYAFVLEMQDHDKLERSVTETLCRFTQKEVPVGIKVCATVFAVVGNERNELHPPTDCIIGGVRVVRNVKAKLNPVNGVRKIDVTFEKPLMPGVLQYKIQAIPLRGKSRMVMTRATEYTMTKLKSQTEYVIKVRPIYDDQQEEIIFSTSFPISTIPKNGKGTYGVLFQNMRNAVVNFSGTAVAAPAMESHLSSEVRDLKTYVTGTISMRAQWNVPLFSNRLDDFCISHFLVEIFAVGGKKLPSIPVLYEDDRLSFESPDIGNLEPGVQYRITVKTYYEEIDTESDQVSNEVEETLTLPEGATSHHRPTDKIVVAPHYDIETRNQTDHQSPAELGINIATSIKETQWDILQRHHKMKRLLPNSVFGEMYHLSCKSSGEEKALLRMTTFGLSGQTTAMLRNDLNAIKDLNHERLLCCYSFVEEGEFFYIFREIHLGKNLSQHVKANGCLDEQKASCFTYQIVDGLLYLHDMNFIHRDIRSENILLFNQDNIKINCSTPGKKELDALCTSSYSIPATLNFTTPEEINKSGVTTAVDIWGVGCVVIEMITGYQPWSTVENGKVLSSLEAFKGPPIPRNSSPKLENFFEKIFVKQEDRPTSHRLFIHEWLISRPGLQTDEILPLETGIDRVRVEKLNESCSPPIPESPDPIGVDEFQLIERLGGGHFGVVFAATHVKTGKRYAVKQLNERMEEACAKREVELSKLLQHPNLVVCYGHYENGVGRLHLVMELMKDFLRMIFVPREERPYAHNLSSNNPWF